MTAIVLDGIQQLPKAKRPPQELLLEWIGEVLHSYEYRYKRYKKTIAEMAGFYNSYGMKTMVLKGYACSLDWPKSKYPFLCTTFFNLQPSCGNCNLHKGNNDGFFCIYTESNEDKELNPFWFEVYPVEKIDSVYGYKAENIKIKLCSHDTNLKTKHQEYFMVDDVY